MLEEGRVEIHEEADSTSRKLHIGKELSVMNRREGFDRLHFDDDRFFYHKIDSIPGIELCALINKWQ